MMNDEVIALAKEAGMKPCYGCKMRHDVENGVCPCDHGKTSCNFNEFVGVKLPIENAAILFKFAKLLLAKADAEKDLILKRELAASERAERYCQLAEAKIAKLERLNDEPFPHTRRD